MRGTSIVVLGLIATSCIGPQPVDPLGYRLSDSGDHWDVSGSDRVFEDAASGRKLMSEATAPRRLRIVGSLEKKEPDVGRIARIQEITASLERQAAALQAELDAPEHVSEATSSLQD
jgi:hypothetical protein